MAETILFRTSNLDLQARIGGQWRNVDGVRYELTEDEIAEGVAVVDYRKEPGNVLRYGRNTTPGTTDMSAAFASWLSVVGRGTPGVIPEGTYAISPTSATVTGEVVVECRGTIKNRDGASATGVLLAITGSGSNNIKWIGGRLDANSGAHSCLVVSGFQDARVHIDEAWGIICTTSSAATTSAVWMSNTYSVLSFDHIHTLDDGTSTQGSIPRAVSVSAHGGVRGDAIVLSGFFVTGIHGAFVIGDMHGGEVVIGSGYVRTAADNGIYNVGNAARVAAYDLHLDATEEPIVNSGSGIVEYYGGSIVNFTNAIGLQDCGGIKLRGTKIASPTAGSANIFKTRTGNTSSAYLHVEDCDIYARCTFAPLAFNVGAVLEVIDRNNRWTYAYDSAVWTTTNLWDWNTGNRLVSQGSVHELVDLTANIANGNYQIEIPTVSVLSSWDSTLTNRTGNDAAFIRLNTVRQQLVTSKDTFAVDNINSDNEINRAGLASAPPREAWGTTTPASGYWQRGSRIWNIAPSASGTAGWICVTAGSPGTWKTFGAIAA